MRRARSRIESRISRFVSLKYSLATTLILLLNDVPRTTLAIEDAAQYHQFLC
jgi:hypothetical protein